MGRHTRGATLMFVAVGIFSGALADTVPLATTANAERAINLNGCDPRKVQKLQYGDITVWALDGEPANFRFTAGMAIDADGAPNAYHPRDVDAALDHLKFAGSLGNWWALVTDNDRPDGKPIIQGPDDPFPGYYIAMTTLEDSTKARNDPRRYVDASRVPYFVLPSDLAQHFGVKVGDVGVVLKPADDGNVAKRVFAIFADVGPHGKLGEGSIALAQALGIPSSPKTGGYHGPIDYIVFPGSGNGKPKSLEEINVQTGRLMQSYGQVTEMTCGR